MVIYSNGSHSEDMRRSGRAGAYTVDPCSSWVVVHHMYACRQNLASILQVYCQESRSYTMLPRSTYLPYFLISALSLEFHRNGLMQGLRMITLVAHLEIRVDLVAWPRDIALDRFVGTVYKFSLGTIGPHSLYDLFQALEGIPVILCLRSCQVFSESIVWVQEAFFGECVNCSLQCFQVHPWQVVSLEVLYLANDHFRVILLRNVFAQLILSIIS